MYLSILWAAVLALPAQLRAEGGTTAPAPIPADRPSLKQTLEDHKSAKPRLPLPPLTDEEKAKLGGRPPVNNGRMRQFYLHPDLVGGEFSREPDPAMSLDPTFKVMLFWIVARSNDCRYCLGHQEWKLASAGLSEERIAALDCDWGKYTPAEQAAFTLARRLTHEPHLLTAKDLEPLRKHYKDLQILEIIFTAGNWNAMTRWTGGLNIPQDADGAFFGRKGEKAPADRLHGFLSPTPRSTATGAARWRRRGSRGRTRGRRWSRRRRWRRPWPPAASDKSDPQPQWVRLLVNFPKAGKGRVASLRAAEDKGTLDRRLRCQVAWIAARQDRSWYALGWARQRLEREGVADKDVWALDGSWEEFTPGVRAAFSLARKLTSAPDLVADADVAEVRKHYTDKQTAELIYQVTVAAFFDRVTEAAGLRLER
jgi:AhpD family alkylhydroperoxidase